MVITWLLLRGARESATANNIMVAVKLVVLAIFVVAGATHLNAANYTPFAPNGFTGIHQGAAIVFFAYIGFDAISTAAEETKNPQRNLPIGILGGLAICTVIYIIIGVVLTGMVPYGRSRQGGRSAGVRAQRDGPAEHREDRRARRGVLDGGGAARVPVRPAAHLLRDGRATACCRSGRRASNEKTRVPYATTLVTGVFVAAWSLIGDAGETYDLTNIGTLFAFIARLHRRDRAAPHRPEPPAAVPRGQHVRASTPSACSAPRCASYVMKGLPHLAWVRFGWWLVIGLVLYFAYGYSHSTTAMASRRRPCAERQRVFPSRRRSRPRPHAAAARARSRR